MNLFFDYNKKILLFLVKLSKKGKIKLPNSLGNLTVELPPSGQKSDISCNAALILSRFNKEELKCK